MQSILHPFAVRLTALSDSVLAGQNARAITEQSREVSSAIAVRKDTALSFLGAVSEMVHLLCKLLVENFLSHNYKTTSRPFSTNRNRGISVKCCSLVVVRAQLSIDRPLRSLRIPHMAASPVDSASTEDGSGVVGIQRVARTSLP